MDIYEAIEKRRTVRDFEDKSIDPKIIKKILSAGLKAPTNNHLREWEFVIVNDKKEKSDSFSERKRFILFSQFLHRKTGKRC